MTRAARIRQRDLCSQPQQIPGTQAIWSTSAYFGRPTSPVDYGAVSGYTLIPGGRRRRSPCRSSATCSANDELHVEGSTRSTPRSRTSSASARSTTGDPSLLSIDDVTVSKATPAPAARPSPPRSLRSAAAVAVASRNRQRLGGGLDDFAAATASLNAAGVTAVMPSPTAASSAKADENAAQPAPGSAVLIKSRRARTRTISGDESRAFGGNRRDARPARPGDTGTVTFGPRRPRWRGLWPSSQRLARGNDGTRDGVGGLLNEQLASVRRRWGGRSW